MACVIHYKRKESVATLPHADIQQINDEDKTMEKTFAEKVAEAKAAVNAIDPREAAELKASHPETVFIDPRSADDIKSTTGIIPGALNVQLGDLAEGDEKSFPETMASHARAIITSCQAGPMGALAAYALKKRGYKNVHYINGGTQGWLDAGFSTTR